VTRKAFIEVLKSSRVSYEIEGDKVVVTGEVGVNLRYLISLPPGVVFKNYGDVYMPNLMELAQGVEFKNYGSVYLEDLTSLPPGVVFKNYGDVDLDDLTSLPPVVVFENGGDVNLNSLTGGGFKDWKGNIEGIDSKRLLNSMVSKGIFER